MNDDYRFLSITVAAPISYKQCAAAIWERLLRFWCRIAHPPWKLTRPVRGHYLCLVCLREFKSWKEGKGICQI